MPVPALKEQIASVTGVLSEQQRLICRGKVLKDDQLLSSYRIHSLSLSAFCQRNFETKNFVDYVDNQLVWMWSCCYQILYCDLPNKYIASRI